MLNETPQSPMDHVSDLHNKVTLKSVVCQATLYSTGRVKEWRVTLGVPLAVSTVCSFVPV